MSTQHTDHATLERSAPQRTAARSTPDHTLHPSFQTDIGIRHPENQPLVDHRQLAARWLMEDECIHALRVADPARPRFDPLRRTTDSEAPRHWLPDTRAGQHLDELHSDYRALLNIHAHRVIWRRPYSTHE